MSDYFHLTLLVTEQEFEDLCEVLGKSTDPNVSDLVLLREAIQNGSL